MLLILDLILIWKVFFFLLFFFFFQEEDGIRGKLVTGVQTCALPIFRANVARTSRIDVWLSVQLWSGRDPEPR